MSDLLKDGIDSYIEQHLPERPEVFHEMEALAEERRFPIVGPQVGHLLKMLAESSRASRVFELGSGFGYSALWFALGLPNDGTVVLTDRNPEYLQEAQGFLQRLWLQGKGKYLEGDAVEQFQRAGGDWDIVFCDIDKQAYPEVIDLAHQKLKLGGWFITDNALWDGRVLDSNDGEDSTKGVLEFNRRMKEHEGFENVILPVRDGVMLARKVEKDESLWLPSA